MKYISSIIILFFVLSEVVSAQSGNQQQNNEVEYLAKKIAKKVKDSLNLTSAQMNKLYDINLSIHSQKNQIMTSGMSRDSIGKTLQRIENTRDSLYRQVIPIEKFELYRNQKRRLINNN